VTGCVSASEVARVLYARAVVCGETCRCKAGQCVASAYDYNDMGVLTPLRDIPVPAKCTESSQRLRCTNNRARECYLGLLGGVTAFSIQTGGDDISVEWRHNLQSMTLVLEIGGAAERSIRARMAVTRSLSDLLLSDALPQILLKCADIATRLLLVLTVLQDDDDETIRKEVAQVAHALTPHKASESLSVCINLHPEVALERILAYIEGMDADVTWPLMLGATGLSRAADVATRALKHVQTPDLNSDDSTQDTSYSDASAGSHDYAETGSSALFVMEDSNVYIDPLARTTIFARSLTRITKQLVGSSTRYLEVVVATLNEILEGMSCADLEIGIDCAEKRYTIAQVAQLYSAWLAIRSIVEALTHYDHHKELYPNCQANEDYAEVSSQLQRATASLNAVLGLRTINSMPGMVLDVANDIRNKLAAHCLAK
ncbi:hypothetical protein SARC_04349, partial [Sphaeroforma arctica JP610]